MVSFFTYCCHIFIPTRINNNVGLLSADGSFNTGGKNQLLLL